MKALGVIWYTQMGSPSTIGIVKYEDDDGNFKFYIGTGIGFDEESDVQRIMSHGAKFDPNVFQESGK